MTAPATAGIERDDVVFGEVLQAIGSAAAGVALVPLADEAGGHAFRVKETDTACIDVVHRNGRWWVCSSSTASGARVVDAAYAYPGCGLDGFTPAVEAAAAWDGAGEPEGWDRTLEQGRWRREPDEALARTVVSDQLVVTTTLLDTPHRRSAIGPLVTHEITLRRVVDGEVLAARRATEQDSGEQHALVVAMAERVGAVPM